jgi:hypothetical protein
VYGASGIGTVPENAPVPTALNPGFPALKVKPGVCIAWEEKLRELPEITGDVELCRCIWEEVDSLAYLYIWNVLLG